MSICFADCPSLGPRKNDLTIYWALGPFVRSFTSSSGLGGYLSPTLSLSQSVTQTGRGFSFITHQFLSRTDCTHLSNFVHQIHHLHKKELQQQYYATNILFEKLAAAAQLTNIPMHACCFRACHPSMRPLRLSSSAIFISSHKMALKENQN